MVIPIISNEQYDAALNRIYELMQTVVKQKTPEYYELEALSILVKDYECEHYPIKK